jgi:hypothetical protein
MEITGPHTANQTGDWLWRCGWEATDHIHAVLSSWPVISIFQDPSIRIWLTGNLQQLLMWSKLSPHDCITWYKFLLCQDKALMLWWDRCLNVNSDCVEVWCVPSTTHMSCIHWSQKNVFGIRVFVTLFLEIPLYIWVFCRFVTTGKYRYVQ